MIAKPTTEQILLECCRELTEVVLPAIPDETVKVSVLMLDLVLRGAAVRAAHEIAWMTEEIDELQAYARDASAGGPHAEGTETELDAGAGPADRSLHLDDVVEAYRRASEAFSRAMEAAVAAGDDALTRRAAALMDHRVERETEVMSGWSPVGR
jgi:hypothetical protein